jgi:E3 ubiquitin-protein ligase HERC1
MRSTDAGGPYRDSIERMCRELQSAALSLFVSCPNGGSCCCSTVELPFVIACLHIAAGMDMGSNRDVWVPHPAAKSPLHLAQFKFLGKLFGLAIRTKNLINLHLPSIVWKVQHNSTCVFASVNFISCCMSPVLGARRRIR